MAFDNAQRGGKAKAGSFAKILCREERVKNLFPYLRNNARTCVNDFDNNMRPQFLVRIHVRRCGSDWYIFGGYGEMAPGWHGVAGIDAEIEQYLVKLGRIARNCAQVPWK